MYLIGVVFTATAPEVALAQCRNTIWTRLPTTRTLKAAHLGRSEDCPGHQAGFTHDS